MSILGKHVVASALALTVAAVSLAAQAAPSGALHMLVGSEFRDALKDTIDAFQKATGVTVTVNYVDEGSINTVLPTQLSSGSGPDVFTAWPGTYSADAAVLLGQRGLALDLSAQPWVKDIPAAFADFVGVDGKIYYPPIAALGVVAMYNDGKIAELGLKKPTTWTEVLAFCKAATGKGVTAYAFGAQTDWQNQMLPMLLAATLVDRVDPTFHADRVAGKTTFAASPWVDVFAREKDMLDAGCFGDKALGLAFEQAQAQVAGGQSLAMFSPASTFSSLAAINPNAKLSVDSLPATDDATQTWLPVALGASFAINAKTQNPEAAIAFVNFLLQPDRVAAYAKATGQAPALPDTAFTPDDVTKLQLDMGAAGRTAPVPDQLFPNPKIRAAWISKNQALLAGQATPADVAKAMDDAWDEN